MNPTLKLNDHTPVSESLNSFLVYVVYTEHLVVRIQAYFSLEHTQALNNLIV